jgi:predicted RNA binding protein YcfA (HicA-like mRNA interferase family)
VSFYGSVRVKTLIKILLFYGFTLDRTRGRHKVFRKQGYAKTLSISCHNEGDNAKKYLIVLVKEATNLTSDEFKKKLKEF